MESELKARWIAALRSGNYQQGAGTLRSASDRYCCLGVLADIIAPNEWQSQDQPGAPYEWGEHSLGTYLPHSILDTEIQSQLTRMNDSLKTNNEHYNDFNAIADHIEKRTDI